MLEGQEKQTQQRSEGSVFCKLSTLKTPCDDDASQSCNRGVWQMDMHSLNRKQKVSDCEVHSLIQSDKYPEKQDFQNLDFFFEYRKNCLELWSFRKEWWYPPNTDR